VNGHTLLRHALPRGTQRALANALFEAYFLEGRDIGEPSTLASVAGAHGFEADEVAALMADDAERRLTVQEADAAARQGIRGVPFFVFAGRLGVSGAQPLAVMRRALEQARTLVETQGS
jgi:predicted DsbA family dithiol-disulfide isomerase